MKTPGTIARPGLRLPGARRLPAFERNVWLFLVANTVVFTGYAIQSLIYNLFLVSVGYLEDFIGLFTFVNIAIGGLIALPISGLSNQIGPRRCMVAGLALMIAASFGMAYATAAPIVLGLGAGYGVGQALVLVPGAAFLMRNVRPSDRPAAFSASFASQSAASVLGSVLGGVLPGLLVPAAPASFAAYQATLAAGAVFVLPALVVFLFTHDRQLEASQATADDAGDEPVDERLVRRHLIYVFVAGTIMAAGTGMSAAFFNVFFERQYGATAAEIGAIFTAGSIAMTAGSLVAPAVARRIGPVSTVVLGRATTMPLFIAFAVAPQLWAAALIFVGRYVLVSMTWPVENTFGMSLMPARRWATFSGVRQTCWYVGWGVAGIVGGLLIVSVGYVPVFLISGALTAAGAILYFLAFRRYQKRG